MRVPIEIKINEELGIINVRGIVLFEGEHPEVFPKYSTTVYLPLGSFMIEEHECKFDINSKGEYVIITPFEERRIYDGHFVMAIDSHSLKKGVIHRNRHYSERRVKFV